MLCSNIDPQALYLKFQASQKVTEGTWFMVVNVLVQDRCVSVYRTAAAHSSSANDEGTNGDGAGGNDGSGDKAPELGWTTVIDSMLLHRSSCEAVVTITAVHRLDIFGDFLLGQVIIIKRVTHACVVTVSINRLVSK
jgi:hypothetical protein